MAKRKNNDHQRRPTPERRFTVRGVRRDPPDMRKLSRALISLAQAEAERQAQAEHTDNHAATEDDTSPSADGGAHDDQPSR